MPEVNIARLTEVHHLRRNEMEYASYQLLCVTGKLQQCGSYQLGRISAVVHVIVHCRISRTKATVSSSFHALAPVQHQRTLENLEGFGKKIREAGKSVTCNMYNILLFK